MRSEKKIKIAICNLIYTEKRKKIIDVSFAKASTKEECSLMSGEYEL